jgi:hypothetical protein
MADRGTATFVATLAPIIVEDYAPLLPGSGGATVDPLRYLNVGGVAVPIQ